MIATIDDLNYSGSATGTLVIAAESIDDWRSAHFSPAQITAGLAADGMDADGDGFTNSAEYALGTDPLDFSPQPLSLAPAVGNNLTLAFMARGTTGPGYAGRTRKYTVEETSDLANPASWNPMLGHIDLVGADQSVEITLPTTGPHKFYRLNVRVE